MIITITGPRSIGKSTISPLVAEKMGLKYVSSDAIGEEALKEHGGLDKAIKSGIIKELLKKNGYNLILNEYNNDNFVFDLSAGSISSTEFPKASQEVRDTASRKSFVIGLLPYKDEKNSINLLFEREQKREHFKDKDKNELHDSVERNYKRLPPIFEDLCDKIIYCEDKKPEEIADKIVQYIQNRKS